MAAVDSPIESIFSAALAMESPSERAAYLDEACAGQPDLRRRVDMLLAAQPQLGRFLDLDAADAQGHAAEPLREQPGMWIGPYRLMEQIGEGGMGLVFVGEQETPLKRKVALKVLKPGLDTRDVVARFEAERQALALMDHPHIAKVLDAGTTPFGRPFFIMELVRGVPITEFCDQRRLSLRERLALFADVCLAVQHAHQRGIIHRDIKPSNVLVTLHDGKPVAKVIDFGVAKALGQRLTERTIYTRFTQLIGTPLYMSPEQAEMSGLDVDTRSDIYSLGVLLYELLTGVTPFDQTRLKQASFDEIRRIIREEEPPKPSTRVSTLQANVQLTVSDCRGADPRLLGRQLHGEPDWIVMKALEKDRRRRYETANDFAQDVQRYLADEPVQACPPTAGYRFRKFARRRMAAMMTTAFVAISLVLGIVLSAWQAVRATNAERLAAQRLDAEREARQLADRNLSRARQAIDRMLLRLAAVAPFNPRLGDLRLRLLKDAVELYRQLLHDRPRDPELRYEAALAWFRYAEASRSFREPREATEAAFMESAGLLEGLIKESPASGSHRFAPSGVGILAHGIVKEIPADRAYRETLANLSERYAGFLLGHNEQTARESALRASQLYRQLVAERPDERDYQLGVAESLRPLARLLADESKTEEAEACFSERQQVLEKLHADDPSDREAAWKLSATYNDLGNRLKQSGRLVEAEAAYRKSVALHTELVNRFSTFEPFRHDLCVCRENLAGLLHKLGKFPEAEAEYRKAIKDLQKLQIDYSAAPGHLWAEASVQGALGHLLLDCNRTAEAESAYRRAIELVEKVLRDFPEAYPDSERQERLAGNYNNLGITLRRAKRFDEAIACLNRAVEIDPKLAMPHVNLGQIFSDQGKLDAAAAAYRKALELDPNDAMAHNNLGVLFNKQGRRAESIASYQKAIEIDPKLALAHYNLGNALRDQSKLNEAVACHRKAIELDPKCALAHNGLGVALRELGELDEAIAAYRKAIELDPKYAVAYSNLGNALNAQNKFQDAIASHRKAIKLDPADAAAHLNLGNALFSQGALDEAVATYRRALDIDPKLGPAHFNLGMVLAAKNRWDDASVCFQTAVDLTPENAHYHLTLGDARGRNGQLGEAIDCYRTALSLAPNDSGIRNHLAWHLATAADAKCRNPAEAVKLASEAVRVSPEEGAYWNTLGVAQYRAGDWRAAIESLHKSMELRQGGDSADWFFLAMAHQKLGDGAKARQWYEEAIEWMQEHQSDNEQLRRFREEAEELLGFEKT